MIIISLLLLYYNDDDMMISLLLDLGFRFPKKGKSSEFNPRDNEQVKSSPAVKVWSHGGSNLNPKTAQ